MKAQAFSGKYQISFGTLKTKVIKLYKYELYYYSIIYKNLELEILTELDKHNELKRKD